MKQSELRKLIREEIKSTLKEERFGDGNRVRGRDESHEQYIENGINKSLEAIEEYLYSMPSHDFAKVMRRWLTEFKSYDVETAEVFRKIENSLWNFDNALNYKDRKVKY